MSPPMNQHEWRISPIVRLELHYLHEIGRINPLADTIIADLAQQVGLSIAMGQTVDHVKLQATHATASNDEDGWAKAVDAYVLQRA